MRKYSRYSVLGKLKKGQQINFQEFYKIFFETTGLSAVAFYGFLNECKALGLVETVNKGTYKILKNKKAD